MGNEKYRKKHFNWGECWKFHRLNNAISTLTGMDTDGANEHQSRESDDDENTEPPRKKTPSTIEHLLRESDDDNNTEPPRKKTPSTIVDGTGSSVSVNKEYDLNTVIDPLARHIRIISLDENISFSKFTAFAVTDELQKIIGEYPYSRTLSSGVILVECNSQEQIQKLTNEVASVGFLGIHATTKIAHEIGTVRGVVKDARICDMDLKLLLHRLQQQDVVHVRPIFTGVGEEKRRSDYTILTFRLKELPEKVFFGRESKRLVPYRNKVIQCGNCWFYGHKSDKCRKIKACEHCAARGTSHESASCQEQPAKCVHCGKSHKASDRNCNVYKKQKAIAKIREEHKIGFKQAEVIFLKIKTNLDNRTNTSNSLAPAPKAPERNHSNFPSVIPSTSGTGHKFLKPNLPDCGNPYLPDKRKNSFFDFKGALLSPPKKKYNRKTAKDFFQSNDESNSDMDSDISQISSFVPTKPNVKKGLKTKNLSDKGTNE